MCFRWCALILCCIPLKTRHTPLNALQHSTSPIRCLSLLVAHICVKTRLHKKLSEDPCVRRSVRQHENQQSTRRKSFGLSFNNWAPKKFFPLFFFLHVWHALCHCLQVPMFQRKWRKSFYFRFVYAYFKKIRIKMKVFHVHLHAFRLFFFSDSDSVHSE